MDINRLHEFIVLADCLNFSKAANKLYLTQPVLSRHIHNLEEEFGIKLLARDTHKVELTMAGEICAREFKVVVDAYEQAVKNISHATDTLNGTITVGFLGLAVRPFITEFTKEFNDKHPHIEINYISTHLDQLIDLILNNKIDIALVTHFNEDSPGIMSRDVGKDTLCLAVYKNSQFYDRETITFKELANEPLIYFDEKTNPQTYGFHQMLFRMHGIEPQIICKLDNVETGLLQVQLGKGSFIVPMHLIAMQPSLKYVPIEDAYVPQQLIWKEKNKNPSVKTFANEFIRFYNLRH